MRGQSGINIIYSAINGIREDKKANNIKINYKKGRETKNNSFLASKQESIREEEEVEEEEEEEEQSKGMDLWSLVWNCMEILKFCMDSSMILYKNYLGMDC